PAPELDVAELARGDRAHAGPPERRHTAEAGTGQLPEAVPAAGARAGVARGHVSQLAGAAGPLGAGAPAPATVGQWPPAFVPTAPLSASAQPWSLRSTVPGWPLST